MSTNYLLAEKKDKYQPKRLMTHQEYRNYLMDQRSMSNNSIIYHGKRVNEDGTKRRMTQKERRKFHFSQAFETFVSMLDKIMIVVLFLGIFSSVLSFGITYMRATEDGGYTTIDHSIDSTPEVEVLDASINTETAEELLRYSILSTVQSAGLAFENYKPTYIGKEEPIIQEPEQIGLYDNIKLLGHYTLSSYDPYEDGDGMTTSGVEATYNHTVAINGLDYGTKVYIPGLGVYYVEDRNNSGITVATLDELYDDSVAVYLVTSNQEILKEEIKC